MDDSLLMYISKRKIVDAKADEKGNISAVKLEGNSNFTSMEIAQKMTLDGKIDAVYVGAHHNTKSHLRQQGNNSQLDNLDDMAGQ
ncbi:MAG: DUF3892 domain-containing protein [Colwellia sp.]|nr:DUF3892 domain-containing protein [Colwellia sp.]